MTIKLSINGYAKTQKNLETLNLLCAFTMVEDPPECIPRAPFTIKRQDPQKVICEFLEKYPLKEQWRIFVDGSYYAKTGPQTFWPIRNNNFSNLFGKNLNLSQEEMEQVGFVSQNIGWLKYEMAEPGSLLACLNTLHYSLGMIGRERNDIKLTQTIQRLLTTGVTGRLNKLVPGEFKRVNIFFGLNGNCTREGIKDLFTQIANGNLDASYIKIKNSSWKPFLNEANKDKAIAYQDILENIVTVSPNNYIYSKKTLSEIQTKYNNYYNEYMDALCGSITTSNQRFSIIYYSVGASDADNIVNLYPEKWEDIGVNDLDIDEISKIYRIFQDIPIDDKLIQQIESNLLPETMQKLREDIVKKLNQDPVMSIDSAIIQELHQELMKKLCGEQGESIIRSLANKKNKSTKTTILPLVLSDTLIEIAKKRFAQKIIKWFVKYEVGNIIEEKTKRLVRTIWEDYRRRIADKNITDDERLTTIGKTVQAFERVHPFNDANGRTFANIILIILLIENGFPPTTFMQPNLFDAFDDLVGVIKRGIANTMEIYACYDNHKPIDLFGFETECLEDELKKEIADLEKQKISDNVNAELDDEIEKKKSCLMSEIVKNIKIFNGTIKQSFGLHLFTELQPPSLEDKKLLKQARQLIDLNYSESFCQVDEDSRKFRSDVLLNLHMLKGRPLKHTEREYVKNIIQSLDGLLTDINIDDSLNSTIGIKP